MCNQAQSRRVSRPSLYVGGSDRYRSGPAAPPRVLSHQSINSLIIKLLNPSGECEGTNTGFDLNVAQKPTENLWGTFPDGSLKVSVNRTLKEQNL